jgi:hypothetical protein
MSTMGWLLGGVLLAGLVALLWAVLIVVARLRRGLAAVSELRATVADGSMRLRAGQDLLRVWRQTRRGTGA